MSKVTLIVHFVFLSPFVLSETFCNAPSVKDGNFNVNMSDENPLKLLGMIADIFSWNYPRKINACI